MAIKGKWRPPQSADQILTGILILIVVHPEINFNLLSGLERGKAWIHG